jgi:cell division protein FtsB
MKGGCHDRNNTKMVMKLLFFGNKFAFLLFFSYLRISKFASMPKLRVKQKIKKILRSPKLLLIAATILVLSATLLFANKGIWRHIALRHEVNTLQDESNVLAAEERGLIARVDLLTKEDPMVVERVARERYHLKRRGETVYREAVK